MKRYEAIKAILSILKGEDIALFTTGMISREAFSIKDRKHNFYILGSMGLITSVALGMALNTNKRVFIFDGDGSALMDMGTLAMIADQKPANLVHIILDNESYESTGGQPTISNHINLLSVADAMGYGKLLFANDMNRLKKILKDILATEGPVFFHVKLSEGRLQKTPRVSHSPVALTQRIKNVLR